jgi:lysophospholipase L1-like esterase
VRKILPQFALVLAGPLIFFGLLEGVLFLSGHFEPLRVLKKVTHESREFWATEPAYGPFALRRPDAPRTHHIWMPVDKDAARLRVVMLGESAVAGFPSEEYSLGRLTRALWNERFPQRPMEIATLALVGVNSHTLRQFAIESMRLQPDVLVIYAGHNEVVGPYGPVSRLASGFSSLCMVRLSMAVRNTRTGRALESAISSIGGFFGGRADKRWRGLDEHEQSRMAFDDPALERTLEQMQQNFRDIIRIALQHNCKVLFCIPAVNLTDWPPMASEMESGKSAQEAYDRAEQLWLEGKSGEAWAHYRRACDLDLLRLRADSRVRQAQRDLVREFSSPDVAFVDADLWMHEWNPAFNDDRDFFLEHVHLSFEGRLAVAALTADGIAELTGEAPPLGVGRGEFSGRASWWEEFPLRVQVAKDRVFFSELDDAYLWQATADLLKMSVFRGMADLEDRHRAIEAKAADLRDQGRARWTAAAIEVAAQHGSAMEPEDGWIDLKAAENLANVGAFAAARKHAETARRKYPRLVQAHTALAHQALRDRQPMVALGHIAAMDDLLPETAKPVELYAVAHLVSGNPAAAIPYLQKIAESSADKAGAWLELAQAQAECGRIGDAIASCHRGMKLAGPDAKLHALLSRLLKAEKDN